MKNATSSGYTGLGGGNSRGPGKTKTMQKVFQIAIREYGTEEYYGDEHNPKVLAYFEDAGFPCSEHPWITDETSWCSAFVNAMCKRADLERSGSLTARSWLSVGTQVDEPEIGDVVVFWRESKSSWKGHVGFYVSQSDKHIYVLGGNQKNMVCIAPYPKSRLLGYRRLGVKE